MAGPDLRRMSWERASGTEDNFMSRIRAPTSRRVVASNLCSSVRLLYSLSTKNFEFSEHTEKFEIRVFRTSLRVRRGVHSEPLHSDLTIGAAPFGVLDIGAICQQ